MCEDEDMMYMIILREIFDPNCVLLIDFFLGTQVKHTDMKSLMVNHVDTLEYDLAFNHFT